MMGSSGSALSSNLDALANLASVLSDPKKFKGMKDDLDTSIAQHQAAEKAAKERIDAAVLAEKAHAQASKDRASALALREAAVSIRESDADAKDAKLTEVGRNLDILKAQLESDRAAQVAELNNARQAVSGASEAQKATERDALTRINTAQAALDKRALEVKFREDAVKVAEVALADAKASFEARSKALSEALKGVA